MIFCKESLPGIFTSVNVAIKPLSVPMLSDLKSICIFPLSACRSGGVELPQYFPRSGDMSPKPLRTSTKSWLQLESCAKLNDVKDSLTDLPEGEVILQLQRWSLS